MPVFFCLWAVVLWCRHKLDSSCLQRLLVGQQGLLTQFRSTAGRQGRSPMPALRSVKVIMSLRRLPVRLAHCSIKSKASHQLCLIVKERFCRLVASQGKQNGNRFINRVNGIFKAKNKGRLETNYSLTMGCYLKQPPN